MKDLTHFLENLEKIFKKGTGYRPEAYQFTMAALNYTVKKLKKPRHISAEELLEGIRQYALEQFGPMARTVLEHWGVTCSEDFGEIVFDLVEVGLLGKTEKDSREDFKNGYDFKVAFDRGYKYSLDTKPGGSIRK